MLSTTEQPSAKFLSKEFLNALENIFSLPSIIKGIWAKVVPAPLKRINSHERDSRIEFYDEIQLQGESKPRTHLYIIDGDPDSYISTTTFIHTFFNEFDADKAIGMIRRGRNYESSPYYGMTDDEIKEGWEKNRDNAATLGTQMHANLENFYNGLWLDSDFLLKPEWVRFQQYLRDHPRLEPFRTEWEVFDEEYKISGSIDMVYLDPDRPGYLIIKDWKRSKEIKWSSRDRGKEPLRHLVDTNGIHYSLQVNLYKWILEKNYNVKVSRLFMVRLHPNSDEYEQIEAEDMQEEIQLMIAARLISLQAKKSASPNLAT